MPNLNHKGPEGKGPKTGRKLGNCTKSKFDLNQIGEPGIGRGLRRNTQHPGGSGLGKRFRYNQTITENKE